MIFLGLKFRILIHGIVGLCRYHSLLREVGPFNNEYPSFCVLILLHSLDFLKILTGVLFHGNVNIYNFSMAFIILFLLIKMLTLLHIRDIIHFIVYIYDKTLIMFVYTNSLH